MLFNVLNTSVANSKQFAKYKQPTGIAKPFSPLLTAPWMKHYIPAILYNQRSTHAFHIGSTHPMPPNGL